MREFGRKVRVCDACLSKINLLVVNAEGGQDTCSHLAAKKSAMLSAERRCKPHKEVQGAQRLPPQGLSDFPA